MKTSLVLVVGMLGFVLSQGQVQAQPGQMGSLDLNAQFLPFDSLIKEKTDRFKIFNPVKARSPAPYLILVEFNTRVYYDGTSHLLVTFNIRNPGAKTVTGVKYDIESWDGHSWKRCKWDFPWSVIDGNAFENVPAGNTKMEMRINDPIHATKYRLLVNKRVHGSREFWNEQG